MFHLRNHCRLLHQGDLNVTQYFNTLTKLRQELDLFNPKDWHDPKDATIYRNFLTRERTYDFLASLDRSLNAIRGRILSVKPLPLIDEIFAKVCREESCKHVMLGPLSLSLEASALAAKQSDSLNKQRNSQFCEHCQKPYHTKATCWKLHGKSVDWVPCHLRGSNG